MNEQEFYKAVEEHSELVSQLDKLNEFFGDAIAEALRKGYEILKKFKTLYPYATFYNCPSWLNEGYFSSIVSVSDKYIEFKTYVRGYGGDADQYPELRFPTSLVKQFYLDRAAFDEYFTYLLDAAIKIHEEKLAKQKIDAEIAERAKFEELKKKFQQNS